MRTLLQRIFKPFFTWLAARMTSAPDRKKVFASLSALYKSLEQKHSKRGIVINTDLSTEKIIIFSDHHKGNKDSSDDFANNEPNYLAALAWYHSNNFKYINLGDSEELWKYTPRQVIAKNVTALQEEAKFQASNSYLKTFGNHDLIWKNALDVTIYLKDVFSLPLPVYEGILLKSSVDGKPLTVYLTHGHQGDTMSDNNAFSTWMVAHLWQPIQRYLRININTPAKDYTLRGKHNIMMYEWSSTKTGIILITGHTHTPVFASGRYNDHPNNLIAGPEAHKETKENKPSYFNSGCCCYNDGDITGIEISDGKISLIKWHLDNGKSERFVLEEVSLATLVKDLYEVISH